MKFSVTINRDEDGIWVVECPAIPGCVSQGQTKDEALENIQDAIYGGRHCYVELHTPNFAMFCESLQVKHLKLSDPAYTRESLQQALELSGPVMLEVDMKAWGPFAAKFAGPPKKTH